MNGSDHRIAVPHRSINRIYQEAPMYTHILVLSSRESAPKLHVDRFCAFAHLTSLPHAHHLVVFARWRQCAPPNLMRGSVGPCTESAL